MTQVQVEERVRLRQDVPELGLHHGDVGVVCSTWFDPRTAFEVEFHPETSSCPVRALLMPNQVQSEMEGDSSEHSPPTVHYQAADEAALQATRVEPGAFVNAIGGFGYHQVSRDFGD